MSTSDAVSLTAEIARYSLTQCVYLILDCPKCGMLRSAISEIPESRFVACPSCHREAEYQILGEGGTARALPFWEKPQEYMFTPFL